MRLTIAIAALSLVIGLPARADAQPANDTRPGIAVFPFTNGGSFGPGSEDLAPLEVGVQQMLLTELAQNPTLRIVERSRIREILDEQGLVRSGQVDPNTAAQVGRLVGARYVITGVFMDLFGDFRLDGRVVDVETGEQLRALEVRSQRENLYQMLVDLASGITDRLELPALAAVQLEERRTREIPVEAVTLYSRAQVYEDGGRREQAIELYRQIADRFPAMTEAREALRQLEGA
jgi:TolB-like protein